MAAATVRNGSLSNVAIMRAGQFGLYALLFAIVVWFGSAASAQTTEPSTQDILPAPELLNPDVPTDEFAHQLIPLTKVELEPLAVAWLGIVRATTAEIADRQVAVIREPDAATDETYQEIGDLVARRAGLFERFTMVVNALESKGGQPEQIAEFRAYRDSVLFNETILANPKAIALALLNWLTEADGGIAIALNFGIVVLAFLALLFVSRAVQGLARRWFRRIPNMSKLLEAFLVGVVYWIVVAIGLLLVLAAVGLNVTPLFAMIGGASFILAFAFQDTLGNLASGLMIMINRPFDEDDYVLVGGVGGTVKSVSIVATTVATPDNKLIVIPNKNVWGNVITNVTASYKRRVDLVFGISYQDSIPEAKRVMETVLQGHPLVLDDPEPVIQVHELGNSSVNLICRPWTRTVDYWTVYWELTHQMKEAFDEAGISIPFPQRDVHIKTPQTN
ncbi:mechanosensitive ion channel family protein [Yoonia sediminilitoris]|uniref:Small-conductance mechanosensitive channel n=1 Tax=Yoonia sediminilitoris TaxID=1286148 RepID=A0A2T6KLY9_9RHOB|nr:mechanosensitive ion channel family protein [Yoonia sediminilitoris]PUB17226.1 small conductance mechanosensitive channel [Yoonia sediminilitoris]RCW97521.1 small conductance mechanosensitive channel [Yoonia sediminilitoris]